MGKKKDKAGTGKANGAGKIPKHIAGFKLPKDVRKTGEALIAKASSPAGQAAIAKGLTLAAGLATVAAARTAQARAPDPAESAEGATPSPAPAPTPPPIDAAKVVEAVGTVANVVLGRLFGAPTKG